MISHFSQFLTIQAAEFSATEDLLIWLGRLPKVDLIILEGGKMSVRTSIRPQKVSSISMKFGI